MQATQAEIIQLRRAVTRALANPQLFQIRRTTNPTAVPNSADGASPHLLPGELGVTIAPLVSKLWVGDPNDNRLLASSVDSDTPLLTAGYLKLSGGVLTGPIYNGSVTTANQLAAQGWVIAQIAAMQTFMGAWDVAANTPNLVLAAPEHGQYWIASTDGTAPAAMPGIGGNQINTGTMVVWNGTLSVWETIPGGGMTEAEGDVRYVQLAGNTTQPMTGALILSGPPTAASPDNQAATKGFVASSIAAMITSVEVDGVTIGGDGTAGNPLEVLRIDGGEF